MADKQSSTVFINNLYNIGHWSGIMSNRRKTGEIEAEWLTLSVVKAEGGTVSNYVAVFSNVSHLIQQTDKSRKTSSS